MSRLFAALVAIAICVPATIAADAFSEGHWRVSQVINGNESPIFLMKVEKKDGKLAANMVEDSSQVQWSVSGIKVDGSTVTMQLSVNMIKYTFEGIADAKDAKVIRGAMFDDPRTFRITLNSQDSDKLEPRVPGKGPKSPEPMVAVQKLNIAVNNLRGQVARSKDANDKAELQDKLKEAQKEADEKVPGLLREVIAKHADSPFAVGAANQLLAGAAKSKAKADEIAAWVKIIEADAAAYGPRIARDTALQTGEMLVSQKDAGALALPLAEKVAAGLKDSDALATQSRALKLLLAAQKATGKTDAGTEARFVKIEKSLDEEYVKKVPPFKPAKFAGRKDKDAKRVAVLELFTGAQCPPCVAADVAFDALEKAYEPTDLVLIQYHMHIPGPDPLTNLDSIARWNYYREKYASDIGGTPSTLFNGKPQAPGGGGMANAQGKFNQYKKIIDELLEEKSPITIGGSAKLNGDKVAVDVNVDGVSGKNIKLRLVLVEETIKYIGGNNLRFHHQVVRSIPDAKEGTAISEKSLKKSVTIDLADVKKGLTKYLDDFANTRPFPNIDRPMDLKHLKVIALVQDDESLEILNAMQFDVK